MSNLKKQKVAIDVPRTAAILLAAKTEAINAATQNSEDGGTCNFDSVVIDVSTWKAVDIKKLNAATGNLIGDKLSSSYWKGYRWVRMQTGIHGQANLNTRQVMAFYRYCKANGLENVSVYSQMD